MMDFVKKTLTLPLSQTDIQSLRAGEVVSLTGIVYTARDAAHKRFLEALQTGHDLPIDFTTAAIYYAGPSPAQNGAPVGSCGPTTSARMDDYTPLFIEQGLRVMIGKGKRSKAVMDAIVAHGAVYFAAIGGAGALYQSCITACKTIAYPELGCEAVYELAVRDFNVVVAIDAKGNSILK